MLIQNVSKYFNSKCILNNITYSFPEKGIIGLTGVNGAGKTTFLKMICGSENYDSGMIVLPKNKVLGYLPQQPNPNPEKTILKECYAGNQIIFQMEKDLKDVEEKLALDYSDELMEQFQKTESEYNIAGGYSFENVAQKILLGLGFEKEQFEVHPEDLSGGWRMRLELARLLIKNPDYLILDEPTNHLDLISIEWL